MKTGTTASLSVRLSLLLGIFTLLARPAFSSTTLIDIAYTSTNTPKVGFAATGLTTNDFWNTYAENVNGLPQTSGATPNLKFVDGTPSGAGLTVSNVGGGNGDSVADPMYEAYLYPVHGGNITMTVTNLSAGYYNFYLYGHGNQTNQNCIFQLSVGSATFPTEATTNGAGWDSPIWQEGVQYVEFTNIPVGAGQIVTILDEPGVGGYACISGMQILSSGSSAPLVPVVTVNGQNVNAQENETASTSITLTGGSSDAGTLAYTVLTQPAHGSLTGTAPSLSYLPATNFSGSDSFTFLASEGTNVSAAATVNISVLPTTAQQIIDVAFTSLVTPKVGFAAVGVTSNDFWNTYAQDPSSGFRTSGVVTNLEFVNGNASSVGLAVTNAYGGGGNGDSDPMYGTYLYAQGGNISLTLTNLAAGLYDFYFYGHGNVANQNTVFQLTVGTNTFPTEATLNGAAWNSPGWQEGVQYVEFTNIAVSAGQTITVQAEPGAGGYACVGGLQIANVGTGSTSSPILTANGQTLSVAENSSIPITLTGSTTDAGTLTYTVAAQPTNGTLSGTPPNLSYLPSTNFTGSDSFTFEASEGSVTSAVATVSITVLPNNFAELIDVAFTSQLTPKVGFAATGITSNDFWNTYAQDPNGVFQVSGVVNNLTFVDGNASGVGLAVTNAGGGNGNGDSDPMYGTYLYAQGGNISLTITNLAAGLYNFYFYGHGNVANQNSVFLLSVGTVNEGSEATTNGAGWNSPVWQEGVQYVEFTNIFVTAGQTITVQSEPGGIACIGGLQIGLLTVPSNGAPVVLESPASQTVASGNSVSFGAVAGGSPSSVQWYLTNSLGTNLIAGATNIPLTLTAYPTNAGGYEAVFSNSFGMATTAVAVLTVPVAPAIVTSPLSQTANFGTPVTFTASASGTSNSVQWYLVNYLGTNAVSGATSNTLKVIAAGPTAGGYYAVFHDAVGSAVTGVANLGVLSLPFVNGSFETNTNGLVITAGSVGVLLSPGATWMQGWTVGGPGNDVSVEDGTVDGLSPYDGKQWIDFHWQANAPGGTLAQTFTTTVGQTYTATFQVSELRTGGPSLTAIAFSTSGAVLASNYCVPPTPLVWTQFALNFVATSTNSTLLFKDTSASGTPDLNFDDVVIVSPPVITNNPVSQTVTNGNRVTFTAGASGSPATVQWWNNSTNLVVNGTNTTLTFIATPANAGNYTAVFRNAAGIAATTPALLTVAYPVYIAQQPLSVTTNLGANVTFAAVAGGATPILFQWQFDGTNIVGATNAALVVSSVQLTNQGTYALLATNAWGSTVSSNAVLALASTLQVVSTNVTGASTVTVPVNLIATGNESVMQFSLDFDPTVLTFVSIAAGSGASGATFNPNTNQSSTGKIGLLEGYLSGTFSAGLQQVVNVTFTAALTTNTVATSVGFGISPVPELLIDSGFVTQTNVTYLAGTILVTPTSLEGDVWPRTNGDYSIDARDWLQEARFVAGLDTVSNASELQRADAAPRSTGGDGVLNAADLAQVARYVVGLDPLTPMGYGSAGSSVVKAKAIHANAPSQAIRTLSVVPSALGALANSATVQLVAAGGENTIDFSLNFDPTVVTYISAAPASGVSGALFILNTNDIPTGKVGFVLGLPGGQSFAAGTNSIVQINFAPISYSNTTVLTFGDIPIPRSVADVTADTVTATYQNGSFAVAGTVWPALSIGTAGGNVSLSWSTTATNFSLQTTTNLSAAWSALTATPAINGTTVTVTVPTPTNTTYYRLSQP
jgi:Cohesin domain/Bacterial Ig domain